MLKKLLTGLAVSFICATGAFAFNQINLPNGSGKLSGSGAAANISLSSLTTGVIYNLDCKIKVNAANGDTTPTIFRTDLSGSLIGFGSSVEFDGNQLATSQAQINDSNEHHVTINGFNPANNGVMGQSSVLTLTILDGSQSNVLAYDCTASYAVGK